MSRGKEVEFDSDSDSSYPTPEIPMYSVPYLDSSISPETNSSSKKPHISPMRIESSRFEEIPEEDSPFEFESDSDLDNKIREFFRGKKILLQIGDDDPKEVDIDDPSIRLIGDADDKTQMVGLRPQDIITDGMKAGNSRFASMIQGDPFELGQYLMRREREKQLDDFKREMEEKSEREEHQRIEGANCDVCMRPNRHFTDYCPYLSRIKNPTEVELGPHYYMTCTCCNHENRGRHPNWNPHPNRNWCGRAVEIFCRRCRAYGDHFAENCKEEEAGNLPPFSVAVNDVCEVCLKWNPQHTSEKCPYLDRIDNPTTVELGHGYVVVCRCCGRLGAHSGEDDWVGRAIQKFCSACHKSKDHWIEECPKTQLEESVERIEKWSARNFWS